MLTYNENHFTMVNINDHTSTEIEMSLPEIERRKEVILYDEENIYETKVTRLDILKAHKNMMQLALADAGWWCHGVIAIEAWVLTKEGKLEMTEGNAWVDPNQLNNENPEIKRTLSTLYESSSRDFDRLSLKSYSPGVGLAGILWSETYGKTFSGASDNLNASIHRDGRRRTSFVPAGSISMSSPRSNKYDSKIDWRNIVALSEDPDQPYDPRMNALCRAGVRRAAGIPFHVRGTQGIILFMTRESALPERLNCQLNEEYLITAADHISSVQALFETRHAQANERTTRVNKSLRRARLKLKCSFAFRIHKDTEDSSTDVEAKDPSCIGKIKENYIFAYNKTKAFGKRWLKKMHGADTLPPPPTPPNVCAFILFAAFITDFIMFCMSKTFKDKFGRGLGFEPGQVASATTMIYALTASPAAQPRSIMLGHVISMCVGMCFAHIPGDDPNLGKGDPFDSPLDWVRLSGSVSISTALMAMFGVAHPPGGAISLIFLRYKWSEWESYKKFVVILFQDIVLIAIAAILSNLHPAKSYPTYWGYLPNRISTFLRRTISGKILSS